MAGPKTWAPGATLTSADQNAYGQGWYGTYTGTTDGSNNLTVTHGAGFTPSRIFLQSTVPQGGANQGYPVVTAVAASTFDLRYLNTAGSCAGITVTGYYWAMP